MRKILLGAGCGLAIAFAASGAFAMGGGWTPPWASPYAILEPQTVAPEAVVPQAAEEGRAAFESRSAHCKAHDKACLRRLERTAPSDQH